MPEKISLVESPISKEQIEKLISWLSQEKTPQFTKGKLTEEFEKKWAQLIGVQYAVFVNSGSSANLIALDALKQDGRLRNKRVVIPNVSWITDISPVIQLGLEPILCDCNSLDLSVKLSDLELIFRSGSDAPAVLILVNVLGIVPEMDKIKDLCDKYGVILIVDNCEGTGSTFNKKYVETYGVLSTTSFYMGHILSTIEGGMVTTNDYKLYNLLKMLRSHGWDRDIDDKLKNQLRHTWGISEFNSLYTFYTTAYNLRSTEINAHIGLSQLETFKENCQKRNQNYQYYNLHLNNPYWKAPSINNRFVVNLGYPIIHPNRDKIIEALKKANIEYRPLICSSMGSQPFYISSFGKKEFINSRLVDQCGFYVPNHPELTINDIKRICSIINEFTSEAAYPTKPINMQNNEYKIADSSKFKSELSEINDIDIMNWVNPGGHISNLPAVVLNTNPQFGFDSEELIEKQKEIHKEHIVIDRASIIFPDLDQNKISPLNKFFDNVFVINLKRRKDRFEQIDKQLKKYHIKYELIEAIDGKNESTFSPILASDGQMASPGDLGCVASHCMVVKIAKARGLRNYFVFEDDAILADNFNGQFEKYIEQLPDDWDMIYAGGNHDSGITRIDAHIAKMWGSKTTHAIGIKSTMYDLLINGWESMSDKVDLTIGSLHMNYNCYVFQPHIAWQADGYSDILNRVVSYDHLKPNSHKNGNDNYKKEKIDFQYIPLGTRCSSAEIIRSYFTREVSLPFDWVDISLQSIHDILINIAAKKDVRPYLENYFSCFYQNKTDRHPQGLGWYPHDFAEIHSMKENEYQEIVEKYIKRWERLFDLFDSGKKLVFLTIVSSIDENHNLVPYNNIKKVISSLAKGMCVFIGVNVRSFQYAENCDYWFESNILVNIPNDDWQTWEKNIAKELIGYEHTKKYFPDFTRK